MGRFVAHLREVRRPANDTYQIHLGIEGAFAFDAGQYINVLHPSGRSIPFSIASAPERLPRVAIDFRPSPDAVDATAMLDLLAARQPFEIDGPHGNVTLNGPTPHALRLIAGGTGIGQCRSIVEHLGHRNQVRPVTLLWSVSHADQLYDLDFFEAIRARHRWFRFETVIDAPGSGPEPNNAATAYIRRHGPPDEADVILAGSPGFVYAVVDVIAGLGGDTGRLRSDVFAYAPRPS